MLYRNLGRSGLKVSELSFGSWLTFGAELDRAKAARCMKVAFDCGVNFFDNAEVYAGGESERIMGQALSEFRREDLVVSTKIFWGGEGPNDKGLSWKHLVEGTKGSLSRLNLEYVDILFCHRSDPSTPIEETVRAIAHLVECGLVMYWGTSEWPAYRIEDAIATAARCNCVAPIAEQPQYNLLARQRVDMEYRPLFEKYQLGTTTWSPLASGILTGKYSHGIPAESRLASRTWLQEKLNLKVLQRVAALEAFAKELGTNLTKLSIAWCLKNPQVSTVILGATSEQQLRENLESLSVKSLLTDQVMAEIDRLLAEEDSTDSKAT